MGDLYLPLTAGIAANHMEQMVAEETKAPLAGDLIRGDSVLNAKMVCTKGTVEPLVKFFKDYLDALHCYLTYYGEEWFMYKDGIYELVHEQKVVSLFRQFVLQRAVFEPCRQENGKLVKKVCSEPVSILVNKQSLEYLQYIYLRENIDRPAQYEHCIPVANGLYNYLTDETYPFTPEVFVTYKLPFAYQHSRITSLPKNPMTDFFDEVLPNKEYQQLLFEYIGYCLTGNSSMQKLLFLRGAAGSGKGVLTRLITMLIGKQACFHANCSQLIGDFDLDGMQGKQVCMMNEAQLSPKEMSRFAEILKTIVGGDTIRIRKKFKKGEMVKLPIKFILSSNTPLYFTEISNALQRRFMTVVFEQSVVNPKPNYEEELRPYLVVLFYYAVEGLRRLEQNKRFSETSSMRIANEWSIDSFNPTRTFLLNTVQLTPVNIDKKLQITNHELYDKYLRWCEAEGLTPMEKSKFGMKLMNFLPALRKRKSYKNSREGYSFENLWWKEEEVVDADTSV